MGRYLKEVLKRLQQEVSKNFQGLEQDKWLLTMLREDEWWLRSTRASRVCKKLQLEPQFYTEETKMYLRDIKVWLPDVQWGHKGLPPCPCCKSAAGVIVHGFRDNHFGRRVCSLDGHYYVISRRYKCTTCQTEAQEQKKRAMREAQSAGLRLATGDNEDNDSEVDNEDIPFPEDLDEDDGERGRHQHEGGDGSADCASDGDGDGDSDVEARPHAATRRQFPSYTFMAHDVRSRQLLPHGYGNDFPAFFTHRSGVDLRILDLVRPLCDKGVRPDAISDILLELHTKAYFRAYEKREHLLAEKIQGLHAQGDFPMFSTFHDRTKYAGAVPTGRYLSTVYKQYARSIAHHLVNEVMRLSIPFVCASGVCGAFNKLLLCPSAPTTIRSSCAHLPLQRLLRAC